ncbi:NAD(P)-binding protein [Aspergillus unguis]
MSFYNSVVGFLYRQYFLYPSKLPASQSLAGQAGLVTGSNTGLGYHASLQLLETGLSHLIIAVRNQSKGEAARKSLFSSLAESKPNNPPPTIEVWDLDLASYDSITAFADRLKQSGIRLNFAILNAGVSASTHELNPSTGHETNVQINWLSTALLTLLLLPILDEQAANASVDQQQPPVLTIVGSETAGWAKLDEATVSKKQGTSLLEALDSKENFTHFQRYAASKLLQQIFIELVNRRHTQTDAKTIFNTVNPGLCAGTELVRAKGLLAVVGKVVANIIGRSVSLGARTLVHAAISAGPDSNGHYLSDNRISPFAKIAVDPAAKELRQKVWNETVEELRGIEGLNLELSQG